MSVDKFGLMGDEPSITIQPLRNYALNLDDLANVEGFNEAGKNDVLYGFKLNPKGLYNRTEVPSGNGALDSGGIENKPLTFVYDHVLKWIPLPLKYRWDIDIQLKTSTVSSKGTDHIVLKIFNLGTMIGSLVPITTQGQTVLIRENKQYFITSSSNKEAHLEFNFEFEEDKKIITESPVKTIIIFDGRVIAESNTAKEILPGLQLKQVYQPPRAGITENVPFDFTIVLEKAENKEYVVKEMSQGLQLSKGDKPIEITPLKIHNFFYIRRIRLTTEYATEGEILYL